jgi:hypothetical protein
VAAKWQLHSTDFENVLAVGSISDECNMQMMWKMMKENKSKTWDQCLWALKLGIPTTKQHEYPYIYKGGKKN